MSREPLVRAQVAALAVVALAAAAVLWASGGRPAEPTTFLTDCLLAALGLLFAVRLSAPETTAPRRWWAVAFAALALAALAGGATHALAPYRPAARLWTATLWTLGTASFALVAGALAALLPRRMLRWGLAILGLKLGLYLGATAQDGDFRWAILDYGTGLLAVLALAGVAWWWRRQRWAPWAALGVAVSLLAAAVQQSDWDLHRHFNHNDLYHVVQAGGLWLLYRGGRRLG